MRLSEFKQLVGTVNQLDFEMSDGEKIPGHYHVTEVGNVTKNFIDCGGTVREEKVVNFQLWYSNDFDHKLKPQKMLDIIALSEEKLGIEDFEIEVEYQSDTIGKYDLQFNGRAFVLTPKMTNCLAPDKCGIPRQKTKINLAKLVPIQTCCPPDSDCC